MTDQNAVASSDDEKAYEESLRRLLAIENQAQDQMWEAGERVDEIITEAEQEAGGIIGGTRAAAEQKADSIVEQTESEAEQEAQEILEDAQNKIDEMREKAEGNMEDAASFLVSWITGASTE